MRVLPINTNKTSKIQHICNKKNHFFKNLHIGYSEFYSYRSKSFKICTGLQKFICHTHETVKIVSYYNWFYINITKKKLEKTSKTSKISCLDDISATPTIF